MLSSSSEGNPGSNRWKCQQGTSFNSFYWRLLAGVTGICIFLSYAFYTNQVTFAGPVPNFAPPQIGSVFQQSDQTNSSLTSGSSPNLDLSTPLSPTEAASAASFNLAEVSKHLQQTRFNCSAVFAGNKTETLRAVAIAKILAADENPPDEKHKRPGQGNQGNAKLISAWSKEFVRLSNQWYIKATKDCELFKRSRGYITTSLTQEEEEFPVAYSMVVFKDIEMVERLLRSVYRPQNRYCIHVDSKSDPEFYSAVQSVAACFPDSVRMSSRRVDVKWGTYTVLEPELICMQDLWAMDEKKPANGKSTGTKPDISQESKAKHKKRTKWKYFINLTGQEFPLKTNHELVKILKAFKGANNEEGTRKRANKDRWKTKAPHGIQPAKGGVHTLLNRATVDFILHNEKAKDLIEWLKTTGVPDETFFATVNYNPQLNIPGTYNGTHMETVKYLIRYKLWWGVNCSSQQTVRGICILSTGDLPMLGKTPHLFANKFYLHQDRVVIGCLEEKLFNDTRDEYLGTKKFDTRFYEQQDFVKHQVPAG